MPQDDRIRDLTGKTEDLLHHCNAAIVNSMDISFSDIVERLKPLDPEKIILFGSYSNKSATEESDIDLCIVKKNLTTEQNSVRLQARKALRTFILENHIGIDILAISEDDLYNREDYFYKVDLLQNGKVLYAK